MEPDEGADVRAKLRDALGSFSVERIDGVLALAAEYGNTHERDGELSELAARAATVRACLILRDGTLQEDRA